MKERKDNEGVQLLEKGSDEKRNFGLHFVSLFDGLHSHSNSTASVE